MRSLAAGLVIERCRVAGGAGGPGVGGRRRGHASVAIQGRELVAVRAGARDAFGLAVDIGTTSLAAALVSLEDGEVAASASSLNPQVAFGADVISRIKHTLEVPEGGAHLAARSATACRRWGN